MIKTSERQRLGEQRAQVVRDLEELSEQLEDDQLDRSTADRLRVVYAEELTEIDAALDGLEDEPAENLETSNDEVRVRGFSYRTVATAAATLMLLTGLIVWAGSRPAPDDAESATSPPGATVEAGVIDIEGMSTEELLSSLESFPESAAVRLVLADRYIAQGDQQAALEQYLVVADGGGSDQERSSALARVGYLSYATSQFSAARDSLMQALDLNAANTEAMLYLGYVLLNGFDDPDGAIVYFERVIADPMMPADVIETVKEKLEEARGRQG